MKKLKIIMLGTAMTAFSFFGVVYFTSSDAEAQRSSVYCEWDGSSCLGPSRTNYCGCETEVDQ